MADTDTETTAATYLSAVRAALADLPPAEVAEILDDIGPHVAEVVAELGPDGQPGTLHDRLGTPQQYAAELRAAAGYPTTADPAPAPAVTLTRPRVALWLLAAAVVPLPLLALAAGAETFVPFALLAAVAAGVSLLLVTRDPNGLAAVAVLPEVRWLRDRAPGGVVAEYGRLFQPGWWLVRAGIVATGLVLVGGGGVPIILLLTVPLALVSVWLGRRSRADRRWLWAVLPGNAFVAAFGIAVAGLAGLGTVWMVDQIGGHTIYNEVVTPQFDNIYPYDSEGRPLTGVYLYDQNGEPITVGDRYSSCQPDDRIPVPANRYPRPEYEWDYVAGGCVARSVAPTPSPLPSGSAGPSASGEAGPSASGEAGPSASGGAGPGAPSGSAPSSVPPSVLPPTPSG